MIVDNNIYCNFKSYRDFTQTSQKRRRQQQINLKPLVGAALGVGAAYVASAKIFKHPIIAKSETLPKSTARDVSEMLLMAGGANVGGVIAGSIGATKEQRDNKINEASFQIMNTAIPMLMVTAAIKACESVKSLNKIPVKIGASFAAMATGALTATNITNVLRKKNNEEKRKYTLKDSLANFDDVVATVKIGFKKVAEIIPVDLMLPFIYLYNGYRSGNKE